MAFIHYKKNNSEHSRSLPPPNGAPPPVDAAFHSLDQTARVRGESFRKVASSMEPSEAVLEVCLVQNQLVLEHPGKSFFDFKAEALRLKGPKA